MIQGNIHKTCILINKLGIAPGFSAIHGSKQAPFFVRTPEMPQGCDINNIRIGGMDDNATNMMGITKPHILPCPAAVSRFINPVSPGRTLTIVRFSSTNPDYTRIGRRHGHITDGASNLVVENGFPGYTVIGGLPHSS